MREQVDAARISKLEQLPWLEVQLELLPPDLPFAPPLDESAGDASLPATVNEWIRGFFQACTSQHRMAPHST